MTLGEATADIMVDGVCAADHTVLVVTDRSIPVDVIVGRTWLFLPHINYYKQRDKFVIESLNAIGMSATSDVNSAELSDVHSVLANSVDPTIRPIVQSDVHIDEHIPEYERNQLLTLLNEYRDVFAKSLAKL